MQRRASDWTALVMRAMTYVRWFLPASQHNILQGKKPISALKPSTLSVTLDRMQQNFEKSKLVNGVIFKKMLQLHCMSYKL